MTEASAAAARPRLPVSHRIVWLGLVALALVILGVFGTGYWVLVRYEPKAAAHIPASTLLAARGDVEQVVLYEPLRRHVFPVLDGRAEGLDRLERFKALSKVNIGMDLREIVVAVLPDTQVVVIIGGLFPQSGLVAALAKLTSSGAERASCTQHGARLTCGHAYAEQATDGCLVFASSEQALDAALKGSAWATEQGMPRAPIALVAREAALEVFGPRASLPIATALPGGISKMTAQADLSDPLQVELAIEGLDSSGEALVPRMLAGLQAWTAANPGPDLAGERALLARATVATSAGRSVVRSTWLRQDLDKALRALGDVVADLLARADSSVTSRAPQNRPNAE